MIIILIHFKFKYSLTVNLLYVLQQESVYVYERRI